MTARSRDIGKTNIYEMKTTLRPLLRNYHGWYGRIVRTVMFDPARVRRNTSLTHLSTTRQGFECEPKCEIDELQDLELSFAEMDEQNRVNAVRFMILRVTSPPQQQNQLSSLDTKRAISRKRGMEEEGSKTLYRKTVYCVKGRRICRFTYSAVVQLNPCTVQKHAHDVASASRVGAYQEYASKRRQSILSQHSVVAERFLNRYGELHGLQFPTGRGRRGRGNWYGCQVTLQGCTYTTNTKQDGKISWTMFTSSDGRKVSLSQRSWGR